MAGGEKNKKGFSLIELLLVIFIMALGIGIALVSFRDTRPLDEVEAAARQTAALVREAQNNSLSGKQQVSGGVLSNICLNGVEWNEAISDDIEFSIFSYVSDPTGGPCVSTNKIENRTEIIKKVQIDTLSASPDAYVSFSVPAGIVSSNGFASSMTVAAKIKIISTANPSVSALVCIYNSGRVEEVLGSPIDCP